MNNKEKLQHADNEKIHLIDMEQVYHSVYSELEKNRFIPHDKYETLTEVKARLTDKQIEILKKTAKKLDIKPDHLLRWLLDTQLERIRQFVNVQLFTDKISQKQKRDIIKV